MNLFNRARTGEQEYSAENNPELNSALGHEAIEVATGEKNEPTLGGVVGKIEQLGADPNYRTMDIYSKMVKTANLPQEEKDQLLESYQEGDDFSALIGALQNNSAEVKGNKRRGLMDKLKRKLAPVVGFAVAASIFVGAGFAIANRAQAKNPAEEAKIESEDESYVEEPEEEESEPAEEVEEVEEVSVLDDENLRHITNYENVDIKEIGDALAERYLDTGEGYEKTENGMEANSTDYNNFDKKTSRNAFNTGISEEAIEALKNGDRQPYLDEVFTRFVNNPANAMAHLALIDPAMEAVGAPDEIRNIEKPVERGRAMYEWVCEQGGEKEREVWGALYAAYQADMTSFDVGIRTGEDWTMYLRTEDPELPMSIGNALLMGQSSIERDHAVQVTTRMEFTDADGKKVIVEFKDNAGCTQPTGEAMITIIDPVTQEETVHVVTFADPVMAEQPVAIATSTPETATEPSEKSPDTSVPIGTPSPSPETVVPGTTTEEDKQKSAESLIEGVQETLNDAGSANNVSQSPEVNTGGNNNSVVNDDNTVANVDANTGEVTSVTDGETNYEEQVTDGDVTPSGSETTKSEQEVQEAVNEGKESGESVEQQNSEIEAILNQLNQ